MEIRPSPKDIEGIIKKVELLWERTKKIRDQFPDSPKLIESANKTKRPLRARTDLDKFIDPKKNAWEKHEKKLKAISRVKNEAWERDIEPLRKELDLTLAPYGDYFCSIGLGRVLKVLTLESVEFHAILQAEAIPERFHKILYTPQKDEYGFWQEKGIEKDVIEAIIHDLKRVQARVKKEAELKVESSKKKRGQPSKSDDSIIAIKEFLRGESIFDDMPRSSKSESWGWIAEKTKYTRDPKAVTPLWKAVSGFFRNNLNSKEFKKLKEIMEKK